jgi:hypothetical protein
MRKSLGIIFFLIFGKKIWENFLENFLANFFWIFFHENAERSGATSECVKFVFLKSKFRSETIIIFQKFQWHGMPHYICKMTGFGKKMKKMEFHCCNMIYHCALQDHSQNR